MAPVDIILTIQSTDFYQVLRGERQFLSVAPLAVLEQQGSYFIQVGDVRWRIGKDLPCLKSASNTYIFAVEGQPDLFYSIVCPAGTPAEVQLKFEDTIRGMTAFQDTCATSAPSSSTPASYGVPSPTSQQVAEHMVKAGQLIAAGLVAAAAFTARGIERGTEMAINKTPAATEPMKPEVKAKLERAASGAHTAATVTKSAVSSLATFAGVAAQMISKQVEKTETAKKMAASKDVQVLKGAAGQAAQQLGNAWQVAAQMVAEKTSAASKAYIQHKYGPEVPASTTNSGPAPGNPSPPPYPGSQPSPAHNAAPFPSPSAHHSPASNVTAPQPFLAPQPASVTSAPAPSNTAFPPPAYGVVAAGGPAQGAPLYPSIPGAPVVGMPVHAAGATPP